MPLTEADTQGGASASSADTALVSCAAMAEEARVRSLEARVAELEAQVAQVAVLDSLVENSQDQLVYLDRDFNFVRVNRAYAGTCRKEPAAFVGLNHFELYPHAENQAIFERVRDTGEPAVWREKPFVFPDQPERGTTYWDWTLTPIRGPSGLVEGLVFSLREVTEQVRARQRIEESEHRFRLMADGAPDQIWMTGPDGGIRFANRQCLEFFGRPEGDVAGSAWQPLVHPEDVGRYHEAAIRAHRERRAFVAEARVRRADGEWRWIESHAEPRFAPDGEFLGHVGITVDVTDRKRTEEALRVSEARLRAHIDNSPLAVIEFDASFRITRWSQEAERLFGWTAAEVIGRGMRDIRWIYEDDADVVREESTGLFTGERPRSLNVNRNYRKDGTVILCEWYDSAIYDAEGRLVSILSLILDITQRKEAEQAIRESEAKYRSLFENMLDAYAFCRIEEDERGLAVDFSYLEVNESFARLTGLEHVVGKLMSEVIPGIWATSTELLERCARVASTGTPERFETYVAPLEAWFSSSVFSPKKGYFVTVFDNITARKTAEAERERMVGELRETDRRKNEFIAVLSHELRNPLTPIRNSLHILEHGRAEQATHAKLVIERQVSQLTRLVDDLLDITRISQSKVRLQREILDARDIVRRAVEDHRSLFDRTRIALDLTLPAEPLSVSADPARLTQVVGNILHNAAKFTSHGGTARVSLEASPDGATVVLRVADDGVGMTAETLARLFQPFVQADQTLDRSRGGLGLGLALVRGLVELHGGTVTAASAGLGRGTEIAVCLPKAAQPSQERSTPAPVAVPRRRILVIEDNLDAAESLRDVLELSGHEVAVEHDGLEGLARAAAFKPEVVFCDIGLPGMDGYEVARRIRADETLKRSHLVALSGYALPEDLRRAAEAGFERHVAKPSSVEKLEEILASLRS